MRGFVATVWFSNDEGEPMQIKRRTKNSAGNGVVANLDASPTIGSGPQVVEYIRFARQCRHVFNGAIR
jgi:hypothetical protein